jgi:hypothetical protein
MTLLGAIPVLAVSAETDQGSLVERTRDNVRTKVESTTNEVRTTVEETESTVTDTLKSQKERIESRKSELREKLEAKAAERKERLEGRRLAQCQNRQTNINELMDKSANAGRDKLVRIQGFEQAIKDFYAKQELSSESYDAAVATVDAREAEAIAALDTMDSWQYDCEAIDGKRPTQDIQLNRQAKREGLKAYRDSVQELLKIVREAFTQKQQEAGDAQE